MKSFKTYLQEAKDVITNVSRQELTKFDKAIAPYTYTVKGSTSRTTTVIIRTPNERSSVKKEIENKLKANKFSYMPFTAGAGSIGGTQVEFKNHQIKILYKPVSGGMSETTLNSTITELIPCVAFMARGSVRTPIKTARGIYDFVASLDTKKYGVYVDANDAKAGEDFIKVMPSSSKFEDKMNNAIGILNYLRDLNNESPIKQLYWGYRKKPKGINNNHKGDIFVEFENGNMLGVSLKAGGEKTTEPQLNTYVNKFFDDIGYSSDKQNLIDSVHTQVHSKLDLPKDWASRQNKAKSVEKISEFKNKNPIKYEKLYDEMLELCRDAVINAVNKNKANTIKYIKENIIKESKDVPLVVIKAFGTSYKQVTDEDQLGIFLPLATSIKAEKSSSSKQNWTITLKTKDSQIVMNMSIRSNNTAPNNKIAQGFNLAIKFNGIK